MHIAHAAEDPQCLCTECERMRQATRLERSMLWLGAEIDRDPTHRRNPARQAMIEDYARELCDLLGGGRMPPPRSQTLLERFQQELMLEIERRGS